MRVVSILYFVTLAILNVACVGPSSDVALSSVEYDLAIRSVNIIDAVSGFRPGQMVLVKGAEIVLVQPDDGQQVVAETILDGHGRYLIPGLWDMHVHTTYIPSLTAGMPKLFLDYGVTSVRDTGGLIPIVKPVVDQWRSEGFTAPHIYFSGPLLDGSLVVYDGDGRSEIGISNPNPDSALRNLEKLVDDGVDFIKIYELVAPDVFRALTDAATQRNLPIAAHVPLSMLAEVAGPKVNSMEHLRNIELACSDVAPALLAQRSAMIQKPGALTGFELRRHLHSTQRPQAMAALDLQSASCRRVIGSLMSTIQVPTLRLNTMFEFSPISRSDWRRALAAVPPALAQQWLESAQVVQEQSSSAQQAAGQLSLQLVSALHQAGVPIGAGTDTPIGFSLPGYSLHTELERLVQAGLEPLEAIRSATVVPAQFFGIETQNGEIATGMAADMVLLKANPLDDISNTRAIDKVVLSGKVVRGAAVR